MNARRTRRAAGMVWAGASLFYFLTTSGLPLNSDGWLIARVAARIAYAEAPVFDENIFMMTVPGRTTDARAAYYSKFPIGQSVLEVPFIWLAGTDAQGEPRSTPAARMILYALPAMLGGGVVALVFLYARALDLSRAHAVLAAAVLAVGSMLWPYARTMYTEITQAFLLTACVYAVWTIENAPRVRLLLAGVLFGVLILVRPPAVVYGVALLPLLLPIVQTRARDVALYFGGPAVLGVAGTLAYNAWRFGDVFNFGYTGGRDGEFGFALAFIPEGLYGLLASPGKGILWYTPLLILAAVYYVSFSRNHGRLALTGVTAFTIALVFHSAWWSWHGDWSWGPRFLVPVLPLVLAPATYAVRDLVQRAHPWRRAALAAVIVASVGVQMLGNIFPYPMYNAFLAQHVFAGTPPASVTRRDPWAPAHFEWAYAPLAGNLWLARVKFLGADPRASCPWRDTGAPVPHVTPAMIPLDWWPWRFADEQRRRTH